MGLLVDIQLIGKGFGTQNSLCQAVRNCAPPYARDEGCRKRFSTCLVANGTVEDNSRGSYDKNKKLNGNSQWRCINHEEQTIACLKSLQILIQ